MMKWSQKRIIAMIMSVALMVSTLSLQVIPATAENSMDISTENSYVSGSDVSHSDGGSTDGDDVSAPDVSGSDINGSDISGSDVSGSDVTGSDVSSSNLVEENFQEEAFLVKDSEGAIWASYEDWTELVADFKMKADAEEEYVISVLEDAVIGKTMPSKAAAITLQAASKERKLTFASATVNMTTPLTIDADGLFVSNSTKSVTVNTKGKILTLNNTQKIGTVKGTSKGSLILNGDVRLSGNLQTFQSVTVNGSLRVEGTVSAVSNLILTEGIVYLAAGKNFTVTNVDATAGGIIGFPVTGTLPKAKIAGVVSGVLQLKLYGEMDGSYEERYFAAGSKLLTAPKASVEQFALAGDGQVCYKKSNVLYVGAEVLLLYAGENYVGTYSQWSDLRAKINTLKDKSVNYRVILLDDYVVYGALSMPTKGRYASLTFENGKDEQIVLQATGGLTQTGDLVIGAGLRLDVSQLSGGAWNLTLGEQSSLIAKGTVTVKNLTLKEGAGLQTGGKLTVKATLNAEGYNELVLTQKKGASVKDTVATDRIRIRMIDKTGSIQTPAYNTTIISVTGNSYATQYCLWDALDRELPLYRKGNALKVKGDLATPITLYCVGVAEDINLGEYATLADVRTEIGRRKLKEAEYRIVINEELFVKGALPMPKAGTYGQIHFYGEPIRTTGNLTLTGNTVFHNELRKVKSERDDMSLSLTMNLAKYTLSISAERPLENIGNVSGAAGSCLRIEKGAEQTIGGSLKVENLVLDGILRVDGSLTVTNLYPGEQNRLDYDLKNTVTIKGAVDGGTLILNPLRDGIQSSYTEGMRVLNSASKVAVCNLKMAQDTDWVFYKDGSVIRLGKALMTVFENTTDHESVWGATTVDEVKFARINDAIEYINQSEVTDFVVRLEENIPSAGAFKAPANGKNIVVCGEGGARKTLNLTGTITLNDCGLSVYNVELKNKSTVPAVTLKNGGSLYLADTEINTLSAPVGTFVTLEGTVTIKGAVTGGCALTVLEDAVVRLNSNVTVETLTLQAKEEGTASLRQLIGKKLTVKGAVTTPEEGQFILNRVNKEDKLADIGKDTVMVVTQYGKVTQFKTENIMPGSFSPWNLIKKGNNIQTSEASQGDGEWSGDYL